MSSRCPGGSGSIRVINMCQSHLEQGRGSIECLICLVHIDGARIGSSFSSIPPSHLNIAPHSEVIWPKLLTPKNKRPRSRSEASWGIYLIEADFALTREELHVSRLVPGVDEEGPEPLGG